jgi:hypothetical protein
MKTCTFISALAAASALMPASALACACGCGVFGVGTSSLFPTGATGQVWIDYDYLNQDRNRSGGHSAPAEDNEDRLIRTNAFTIGGQYMLSRAWSVSLEVPYWQRSFISEEEADEFGLKRHAAGFGDIRLNAVFTGFSPDLSTGLRLGVKLPTGGFHTPGFDRDTAIGTGSTDLLIGGFHQGALNQANTLSYFVQAQWDRPVAYRQGYRPGQEIDGAVGVIYSGLTAGRLKVSPVLQLIAVHRDRDGGPEGDPDNSGYDRILASPGVEVAMDAWKLYGDVELPVHERYRGQQLAAPALFKVILSKEF